MLVEQGLKISRELYLGIVLDRSTEKPVLMVSQEGGVEIEKVAEETPDRIFREYINPAVGLAAYQTRKLAFALGLDGPQIAQASKFMTAVWDAFRATDASLIEINPLIVTEDGTLLALDAKMTFDDNALYRHPDIKAMRDLAEEDPLEIEASNYLSAVRRRGAGQAWPRPPARSSRRVATPPRRGPGTHTLGDRHLAGHQSEDDHRERSDRPGQRGQGVLP